MAAGKCVSGLPRRSICRSSSSVPIDSGSTVSLLFLKFSSRKRDKRPTDSGRDVNPIPDALSSIRLLIPQIDSGLEDVIADIDIAQLCQPIERRWQLRQSVVVKIEKIREAFEVAQGIRDPRQFVVSQIEHSKAFKPANPVGHFGQIVFSQHQGFEPGLLPYPVWHAAKALLPQAQMRRRQIIRPSIDIWHP